MKLYVTMLNLMPLQFDCPPTRRMVEIELTPEQKRQIKPRFVGKSRGIEHFESVESCVLGEDDDPDWLEGGAE